METYIIVYLNPIKQTTPLCLTIMCEAGFSQSYVLEFSEQNPVSFQARNSELCKGKKPTHILQPQYMKHSTKTVH